MHHRKKGLFLFMVTAAIFLISSCSLKYAPQTGEEFSREMIRLEKLAQENPDPSVRARARLQLARLYTHHKNPQRDYLKGCKEFSTYLSLVPADRKNDEIQNWVSVLEELELSEKEAASLKRRVERLTGENTKNKAALSLELRKNQELQASMEKLQSRLENLEKTHRSLNETNRNLKESNEKMKETIERLKELDLQMEERRKAVR